MDVVRVPDQGLDLSLFECFFAYRKHCHYRSQFQIQKPIVMKTQLLSAFLLTFIFFLTSCEVIGGIFKAGVWVGVVVVVGILALVGVLIGKSKK